ncbi:hypothetical protein ADUPG1_011751 [Aduncisulcus paluster]|uniref:Uncharacterized protein n=1 Tax=Aduncisulcus paluster TaxID=2918883 RepID=A0ABQ5JX13_9EUKA|nr:hypothetical protein ADUPG1_011751 [Aduncisulcus paluster]
MPIENINDFFDCFSSAALIYALPLIKEEVERDVYEIVQYDQKCNHLFTIDPASWPEAYHPSLLSSSIVVSSNTVHDFKTKSYHCKYLHISLDDECKTLKTCIVEVDHMLRIAKFCEFVGDKIPSATLSLPYLLSVFHSLSTLFINPEKDLHQSPDMNIGIAMYSVQEDEKCVSSHPEEKKGEKKGEEEGDGEKEEDVRAIDDVASEVRPESSPSLSSHIIIRVGKAKAGLMWKTDTKHEEKDEKDEEIGDMIGEVPRGGEEKEEGEKEEDEEKKEDKEEIGHDSKEARLEANAYESWMSDCVCTICLSKSSIPDSEDDSVSISSSFQFSSLEEKKDEKEVQSFHHFDHKFGPFSGNVTIPSESISHDTVIKQLHDVLAHGVDEVVEELSSLHVNARQKRVKKLKAIGMGCMVSPSDLAAAMSKMKKGRV